MGPASRPEQATRFSLVLTCAKNTLFCNSQHRGVSSLRKGQAHPEVELHPQTAAARGIANGNWVAIETPTGRVRAVARFNASLDPRVVVGQHGWWQSCDTQNAPAYDPFSADGPNFNLLISGAIVDPDGAGARVFFQRVPEGKTAKNRVHLDVRAAPGLDPVARRERLTEESARLIELGATKLYEFDERGSFWITMQDPEGNEFCLD
jgi:anaerobic selenocysteine-containing dehydrogenase